MSWGVRRHRRQRWPRQLGGCWMPTSAKQKQQKLRDCSRRASPPGGAKLSQPQFSAGSQHRPVPSGPKPWRPSPSQCRSPLGPLALAHAFGSGPSDPWVVPETPQATTSKLPEHDPSHPPKYHPHSWLKPPMLPDHHKLQWPSLLCHCPWPSSATPMLLWSWMWGPPPTGPPRTSSQFQSRFPPFSPAGSLRASSHLLERFPTVSIRPPGRSWPTVALPGSSPHRQLRGAQALGCSVGSPPRTSLGRKTMALKVQLTWIFLESYDMCFRSFNLVRNMIAICGINNYYSMSLDFTQDAKTPNLKTCWGQTATKWCLLSSSKIAQWVLGPVLMLWNCGTVQPNFKVTEREPHCSSTDRLRDSISTTYCICPNLATTWIILLYLIVAVWLVDVRGQWSQGLATRSVAWKKLCQQPLLRWRTIFSPKILVEIRI